jgi:PASTA domain-containing protein
MVMERLRAHLPRVALFVLLGLATTATLTYAAGRQLGSAPGTAATPAPVAPLVVPNVKAEAFVFAKGALEDAGFAWRVVGTVHGYAANTVASQSPAAGTRVLDTGAPLITLTLKRNSSYPQKGSPADTSPYQASVLQPAELAAAVGPAHPATTAAPKTATTAPRTTTTVPPATTTAPPATTTAPPATTTAPEAATTTPATTTTAPAATTPAPKTTQPVAAWPQTRPVAFTVPGARKEPLDEMPLTTRALQLQRWLEKHPSKTNANVSHWLYQNAWIVAGAKLGWWRGADALTTLVAVDKRTEALWGIGAKSANDAAAALRYVAAKSAK